MQAIVLHPKRRQLTDMLAGIAALGLLAALVPLLSLPVGLALPLFACPLIGTKKQWAAVPAALIAPAAALLSGQPAPYAASLLLSCGLPVLAALLLRPTKSATGISFLYYFAAYAIALSASLLCLSLGAGLPPARALAAALGEALEASPDFGRTLYALAASGLISVPAGAQNAWALALNPALTRQMILSLHLTLETLCDALTPALVVQACLLGGVFTALRVQRLHHSYLLLDEKRKEPAKLAMTPGFSLLELPKKAAIVTVALALTGFCLAFSPSSWCAQLSALCWAAFQGVYQLLGAAALIGALCQKKPDSKALWGALAAALYLLAPTALLFLGLFDPILHFRHNHTESNKEDAP